MAEFALTCGPLVGFFGLDLAAAHVDDAVYQNWANGGTGGPTVTVTPTATSTSTPVPTAAVS